MSEYWTASSTRVFRTTDEAIHDWLEESLQAEGEINFSDIDDVIEFDTSGDSEGELTIQPRVLF
jgi:hypothetical protein